MMEGANMPAWVLFLPQCIILIPCNASPDLDFTHWTVVHVLECGKLSVVQ
jgi:hypothetical protein